MMKMYILLLSDAFLDENFSSGTAIGLRDVESCSCYCSSESAALLRERLSDVPLDAPHWIDTGDYHYLSLFFLERIGEPFELILADNHPDDQPSAFAGDGMLSCGSWVKDARGLPNLQSFKWLDGQGELQGDNADSPLPVYLSLDLDCLDEAEFKTDWNQGLMRCDELVGKLEKLVAGRRIIGIDICGGISRAKGARDCDLRLNANLRERLISSLNLLTDRNPEPSSVPHGQDAGR